MSFALYRKYRPQTFAEFVGQEYIVKTLTNAISFGLISHAYLFSGPMGCGKTSLARLFAKAVNCQKRKDKEWEPCNSCDSCVEINEGRAIDLIEIDAASHRSIEDIRELREGIKFTPTKSKYKIFILDEAHQLSKDAVNALLKTLEEPPEHAIFILATTEIHKMIPTIVSRCQRFDFRRLTTEEILKKLEKIAKKEKIKIEESALKLIALNSQGSLRNAESLLDQIKTTLVSSETKEIKTEDVKILLGLVEIELISKFTDFLLQKNAKETLNFLNEAIEKNLDLSEFVKALLNYFHQALLLKIMGKNAKSFISGLTPEEFQKLKIQTEALKEEDFKKIINIFLEAQRKIQYSPTPQLPLELAIIEICQL